MEKPLTIIEKSDLRDLEHIIEKNKKAWLEVGRALTRIRDHKLYRTTDKTFEDYVQRRWGWSRQRAYQLIQSTETVESLSPKMSTAVDTEASARELSKVPEKDRETVVETASKSGTVTAPSISRAAKQVTPEEELDDMGFPVPEYAKEYWGRKSEVVVLLNDLANIKKRIKFYQDGSDQLFAEVNFHSLMAHLDQSASDLKRAKPYAVCPGCQGKLPEKCQTCKGRGVVSKFLYDCTDAKLKHIRESMIKK